MEHLGERLISACTQGLRQGACVLSSQSDAPQRSTLAAEVRWDEDFRVATIRVLRQGAPESDGTSGKIVFDGDDALEDRWTTAGFTIATLVGDLTSWTEQRSNEPAPKEPPRAEPAPARAQHAVVQRASGRERSVKLRTAAGLAVGQGMHDHAMRTGPWASLSFLPVEIPLAALVRGGVTWAQANHVRVRWSTVAVGLEARWPAEPSRVGVVFAADAGVSHVLANSERTASRTSVAFSTFAGGEVALAGPVGLLAGARLDLAPTTQLATSAGLVVDRRLKFGGGLGVVVKL